MHISASRDVFIEKYQSMTLNGKTAASKQVLHRRYFTERLLVLQQYLVRSGTVSVFLRKLTVTKKGKKTHSGDFTLPISGVDLNPKPLWVSVTHIPH
jgi:hypothetical protein